MKPLPPDLNELLRAIEAARPLPPGPGWYTLVELFGDLKKRGSVLSVGQLGKRLRALRKSGGLDVLRAPRRGTVGGWTYYYRSKNGRRPASGK